MNFMKDDEYLLFMAHNYTREDDDNKSVHFPGKPYVLNYKIELGYMMLVSGLLTNNQHGIQLNLVKVNTTLGI